MRVVVIGGGISGLTAAYLARGAGHDVTCVEPGVPGGLIRSERIDGFLCEAGPQAVLDDAPETLRLIEAVGLGARVVPAAAASRRRSVFLRGRLQALPASPPALIRSGLLSAAGKLRLLAEPLVGRRRNDGDETVAAFGARRLGKEAGRLLATAVIGLYAADAEALSMQSALPRLHAMEREHGSLFRGVMAGRKAGRRPGRPLSFPDGLGELPTALAAALGPRLVRARATALAPRAGGGWHVALAGATAGLDADAVVLATDAAAAAELVAAASPAAAAALGTAAGATSPVAVACLGFRTGAVGMDVDGYGFLVARGEGPRLLGCQYESSIFPGRAPDGGVLVRAILGGHGPGFEPDIVERSDDAVAARAVADLGAAAGLARDPDIAKVYRYPRGIPRYEPGHAGRVAELDAALAAHRGLHVIGHAVRGVGVNESIRAATALVNALG